MDIFRMPANGTQHLERCKKNENHRAAIALEKDSQYSLVDAMLVSILDPLFDVGVCEILPEALKQSGIFLISSECWWTAVMIHLGAKSTPGSWWGG